MAALRMTGITKAFAGQPVLRSIDLQVASGELVAILGSSGSGKTTLLRVLSGFERADFGEVEIDGRAISGPDLHVPPERRQIGYVAQEGALFPHLSVGENVLFGLPASARRNTASAGEWLELVGLPPAYAERAPQELSGGEQQRVALARALAPKPRMILLDEPFSALDAALRVETRQTVVAALTAARTTALLVTHDQSEALSTGRRVAVLRGGRLVQVATPEMLYRQPVDAALAQFVGDAVLLPATAVGHTALCSLGSLRLTVPMSESAVDVLIRPEQIRLRTNVGGAPAATVVAVAFYGHDANVMVRLIHQNASVVARVSGHAVPKAGDLVDLDVEGSVMAYPRERP